MNSKLAPVIKKIKRTTIKLTPLDIPLNDYLAEIFEEKEEASLNTNLEPSNSAQNIETKDSNEYNDNYLCNRNFNYL